MSWPARREEAVFPRCRAGYHVHQKADKLCAALERSPRL